MMMHCLLVYFDDELFFCDGLFVCDVVMKLFMMSIQMIQYPIIVECISLPCLGMLQQIIKPAAPTSKKNKVILCASHS